MDALACAGGGARRGAGAAARPDGWASRGLD